MFWADRIASEIRTTRAGTDGRPLLIRDEKTISGRVHIGSMRGVAIHGLVSETLTAQETKNEFLFEMNDFDDFDSVPEGLDEAMYQEHLGKPLYAVPSPASGFDNFAEYYGAEFVSVHQKAGFIPTYYRASELYRSGKMDDCIRTALEKAPAIRRILKEVSGSVKDESWLPISVLCEACGKLKTTNALDYDGETVGYICDQSPYGAKPCGHTGRRSPYGGAAKLFWKVDWAAKWVAVGVDIEGGGKDHSTKGGSRDVANHIARDIYGYEPPFNIPYEFFLVGGKKMSSSKGRGSSAKEMSELFPSEVLRLILIGKDINQQIDVDPSGDSVPRMYDWYDDLAERVRDGIVDDFTRLYQLCQLPENQAGAAPLWLPRFGQVAFIVQMPHLDLEGEAEAIKGAPLTDDERIKLKERADYARFWIETYAPEQYVYRLQETLPTFDFTDDQRKALSLLAAFFETGRTGAEVQQRLFELKDETGLAPKELFTAIYQAFLGRTSGPKAGWFLSVLPRDFVMERLLAAAQG
ncbi:MAG TPA: lysine--tRNA ligase [Candidatus Paceibacterota bacterium]|nr:lysine--tRNA ligase [Candidatus Paceibacterota bacterium]